MSPSQVMRVTPADKHCFFGYFDRSPWSPDGNKLLLLESDFMDRPPVAGEKAHLGIVEDGQGETYRRVAETRAWNFQQGAMQQWLPGDGDALFVHNDAVDGKGIAVVRECDGAVVRELSRPIYHLSPDGDWGLSLNFGRLAYTRPGYGYPAVADAGRDIALPGKDGIWMVSVANGESHQVLDLTTIVDFHYRSTMDNATHWFNHLLFSPDGKRFAFMHRWKPALTGLVRSSLVRRPRNVVVARLRTLAGKVYRHFGGAALVRGVHSSLLTAAVDGSDIRVVADCDDASHFSWRNDREIIVWARHGKRRRMRYWLVDDRTGESSCLEGRGMNEDGHCTFLSNGQWVLSDTYPDRRGEQALFLYDCHSRRRVDIGRFRSHDGLSGEIRCDLHPRADRSGSQVCFDSTHEGYRAVYVADIQELAAGQANEQCSEASVADRKNAA